MRDDISILVSVCSPKMLTNHVWLLIARRLKANLFAFIFGYMFIDFRDKLTNSNPSSQVANGMVNNDRRTEKEVLVPISVSRISAVPKALEH